jgi:hypothetical protein
VPYHSRHICPRTGVQRRPEWHASPSAGQERKKGEKDHSFYYTAQAEFRFKSFQYISYVKVGQVTNLPYLGEAVTN